VVALFAACALVACSGDDDTANPTTTATSALAAVATTGPPITTRAVPTPPEPTNPPTTPVSTAMTSSPGSVAPTTAPGMPGTSPDPHDPALAPHLIYAAAEGAWRTLGEALADPLSDEKYNALALYRTGDNLARAQALVQRFRDENLRVVPHPNYESEVIIDPMSLVIDPVDGFATMRVCEADTEITIEVGGNPDGSDRVVNDELSTVVDEADYVIVDDTWKRIEERNLSRTDGATSCN
jgi:hypothetical protein